MGTMQRRFQRFESAAASWPEQVWRLRPRILFAQQTAEWNLRFGLHLLQVIEQTALRYFAGSGQSGASRILRIDELACHRRHISARHRVLLLCKL